MPASRLDLECWRCTVSVPRKVGRLGQRSSAAIWLGIWSAAARLLIAIPGALEIGSSVVAVLGALSGRYLCGFGLRAIRTRDSTAAPGNGR